MVENIDRRSGRQPDEQEDTKDTEFARTGETEQDRDTEGSESRMDESARKVLQALNRVLDSNEKIRAVYKKMKRKSLLEDEDDDAKTVFMNTGKRIIKHYSERASLSGGLSSLPAMIPGLGTVVALVGASAVDIVAMLKFEIEMSLCLCHLAGFDIDDERDRQLAFTLATVSSHDILSNRDQAAGSASIVGSAFWDYSLRELSKHAIRSVASILCINLSKGLVRAVPIMGMMVGASFNMVMTRRSGLCCLDALWIRRRLAAKSGPERSGGNDIIYDAAILDEGTEK